MTTTKRFKCTCQKWKQHIPRLESLVMIGFVHGMTVEHGVVFKFCPWCGKKLKEVKVKDDKKKF